MLQDPVINPKKQPFLQDCPQFDLDCRSCRTLQLQIEPEVSVQHRATFFVRLLLVYFLTFNPLCSPKNTNWAVRLSDPLNDQIKARVHKNTHEQAVVTQPRTKQKSPSGSDLIFLSIWAPHFLVLTLQMKELCWVLCGAAHAAVGEELLGRSGPLVQDSSSFRGIRNEPWNMKPVFPVRKKASTDRLPGLSQSIPS